MLSNLCRNVVDFVVENGSDDMDSNDDEYTVYCESSVLHSLNEKIISKFGQTVSAELIWKSDNTIEVLKDTAEKLFKLLILSYVKFLFFLIFY